MKANEKGDEQTLRRHRLTERLFADVFETPEEVWEKEACQLENRSVLSEEAVEAICAFLGHPPTCPHGRPIPRGNCCRLWGNSLEPFVIPLPQARLSESYRIVFVAPKGKTPPERLAGRAGLPPGGGGVPPKKK